MNARSSELNDGSSRRRFLANLLFLSGTLTFGTLQQALAQTPVVQVEEGWELPPEIQDRLTPSEVGTPEPPPAWVDGPSETTSPKATRQDRANLGRGKAGPPCQGAPPPVAPSGDTSKDSDDR